MGQDESRAMLAMIDEAFQVLADDTSRAQYDASIGISRSTDLPRPPLPETSTPRFLADAEAMAEQQASAMAAPPPMSAATDSSPRRALTPLRTNARSTRDPQTQAEYAKLRAAFQPDDGQLYRRLREAAGLSEGDVQRWTKMSLEHIRSIENNTLHRLPPLVYVKGYLRSLFKYLDVPDAEPLVNAFAAKIVACQQNTKG
jgi:curved DNA-binding protein CbpA